MTCLPVGSCQKQKKCFTFKHQQMQEETPAPAALQMCNIDLFFSILILFLKGRSEAAVGH